MFIPIDYLNDTLKNNNRIQKTLSKHNLNFSIFFIRLILITFLLASSISTALLAQDYEIQKKLVYDQLDQYTQVYLSIPVKELTPEIATLISIDFFEKDRVFIYANRAAVDTMVSYVVQFRFEKSPGIVDFDLNMLSVEDLRTKGLSETWDFYPTYEAYEELMYQFEEDFPNLVKIHDIGNSVLGRDLLFAQIMPNVEEPKPLPQFMYTSTIHGDETTGFIVSLRLIHYLLNAYGVDPDITDLMNSVEIWICPNENPDGTYTNNNSTVNGATRFNANGKDLNRNYPSPHPSYPNPPETPIQPETQAMIDFVSSKNFIMSANMHGGIELVNYPWDSWTSNQKMHADHNWWEFTMNEFVDTVHAYSPSGYMTGQGNGVTHGGDWYVAIGTRQDYLNYFHSCREFTLEMSDIKLLPPTQLPAHWEYNYRSLIQYIRQSTYGIHGTVVNGATNQPLIATISLPGHDFFSSEIVTSTTYGNFSRPVLAGTYDVTIDAEGFDPVTMPDLTINNYETVFLNVILGEGNTQPLYVYSSDASMGEVSGAGLYPQNYEVTITAEPKWGFEFSYWEDADGEIIAETPEVAINMPSSPLYYKAVFKTIPTEFAVHFATGEGSGTVKASINGSQIISGYVADIGSNVLFVAKPATGYEVSSWEVNGNIIPDYQNEEYLVEDLTSVINLETNFSLALYDLSIGYSQPNAGTVNISPNQTEFHYGESVSLNVIPNEGYIFDSWLNGDGQVLSTYDSWAFSMPAHDVELTAVFTPVTSVTDITLPYNIKVYPNPARDLLTVDSDFNIRYYELVDENGSIAIRSGRINRMLTSIDLSQIGNGLYLLKVYGDQNTVVRKVQIF